MGRAYFVKAMVIFAASSALAVSALNAPAFSSEVNASLRQGLPGRRISGGSRSPIDACIDDPSQSVIALMPQSNLGKTIAERPTFWFSLPAVNQDRSIEFGLFDSEGDLVFKENLSATGEAGLAQISLPERAAPLMLNQDYRWYLSVVCDQQSRAEDLTVTGWVRRLEADSEFLEQLATSTPQEQVALYSASDLWFDTLTALSAVRHDHMVAELPGGAEAEAEARNDTSEQHWASLMQSVDLPQVILAPFVGPLEHNSLI